MIKLSDLYGKTLSKVLVEQSTDFVSTQNYVLADKINFVFLEYQITIIPQVDTDELKLYVNNNVQNDIVNPKTCFNDFVGMSLANAWEAKNMNGYTDIFILAFNNLKPNILILSEGSVLKLFKTTQL